MGGGADPVVHCQRPGGRQGGPVHRLRPRCGEEHQRIEGLVAVPAVQVGQKVGRLVEGSFQRIGQPGRQGARRIAGEGPVQVDSVLRHHLFSSGVKASGIGQRQEDDVSRQFRRIQLHSQAAQGLHPHILAAVDPRCDHQRPARSRSAQAEGLQRLCAGHRQRDSHLPPWRQCHSTEYHTATSFSSVSNTTIDSSSRRAYSSFVSLMRHTGRYSVTRPW